jgi:alkanesulfonate monooxygenase SsuD/methylene tetrahydromethanopterin reductase-like flavin-dependent oxidoreductase (luciferase family)
MRRMAGAEARIGLGMVGGLPVREAVGYARAAEDAGVTSFWVHETYGLRDALSYVTAAALVTSRIELGAGCVNSYTRNAALLAMSGATIQELAAGRFRLAIGTAYGRLHNLGYHRDYSLSSLREITQACRQLWRGETVTIEGHIVKLNGMNLQLPPCDVPIYHAVKGPKSLSLAAELADGQLDGPMVPASVTAAHIAELQSGIGSRPFRYASYIFCSFAEDRAAARDAARGDPFLLYLLNLEAGNAFMTAGLDPAILANLRAALRASGPAAAAQYVTDDVVDRYVLCGTPHDVVDQLQPFVEAGLQEPILQPLKASAAAFRSATTACQAFLGGR